VADYTYSVSIVIRHPSITADEISKDLGLQPTKSINVGSKKYSPNGEVYLGISEDTYWRCNLHSDQRARAEEMYLEDFLVNQNAKLEKSKSFLNKLVESGGYIEYFIGVFGGEYAIMATLSPSLLKQTAELNIAIGFDIYANG